MRLSETVYGRLPSDSILKSLPEPELDELLGFAVTKKIARNETLIELGDPGDSMMVVLSGTLKACVGSASGKEVVLEYLGAGSIIGELALFDGEPRAASVVAIEPAELVILQRRFVLPFLERKPSAALSIIRSLCHKMRRTNSLVRDTSGLAMGPKLARGLLRLMDEHGERKEDGLTLTFRMNQSDLGNYVSLSRENVNRQLKMWEEAGVIRLSRGNISILDEDALRAIAESLD